jgi:ABC-2 type transport system permease protein
MTTTAARRVEARNPADAPGAISQTAPAVGFWLPAWSLASRELVRFFRQRTRVVGALGQPFIFWVLFGAGLGGTFRAPAWAPAGMSYQEYFLPGVAVLIVLFTAIFSTISIIEDRREGFLQAVLVAPLPRASIVLGKVAGGTALAVIQASLFLLLGPLLWLVGLSPHMSFSLSIVDVGAIFAFLVLQGFALTGLGYVMAWPLDSTQGYHALMSVLLMPMWLLSGAFFPVPESGWLAWVMWVNPLTYGVVGLQRILFAHAEQAAAAGGSTGQAGLPSVTACLAVTAIFCVVAFVAAVWLTGRRSVRNARS